MMMKYIKVTLKIVCLKNTDGINVIKLKRWVLTEAFQEGSFKLFQYLNLDGALV